MSVKLKPKIKKIANRLKEHNINIVRVKGDHIAFNRVPKLERPIILPNKNYLGHEVRKNLRNTCRELGIEIDDLI